MDISIAIIQTTRPKKVLVMMYPLFVSGATFLSRLTYTQFIMIGIKSVRAITYCSLSLLEALELPDIVERATD